MIRSIQQAGTGTCGTRPFASERCGLSSDPGSDGSLPFQLNAGREILGQFPVARSRALFLGPNVEEAAKQDELAEVVGIVVNQQNGFVGEGLTIGVRNGCQNIGFFERGDEFLAVSAEGGDGLVPCLRIGRLGRLGPVALGKIGRFVFGVESVVDDVPLG